MPEAPFETFGNRKLEALWELAENFRYPAEAYAGTDSLPKLESDKTGYKSERSRHFTHINPTP